MHAGSGVVRAGQWARSLILNDNIKTGSILPYLDLAARENWGVVVFNPNVEGSDSAEVIRNTLFLEAPTTVGTRGSSME